MSDPVTSVFEGIIRVPNTPKNPFIDVLLTRSVHSKKANFYSNKNSRNKIVANSFKIYHRANSRRDMEEIGRSALLTQRVIELYKEEGVELTTQQAEKILELCQKLVNIVVRHYRTAAYTVDLSTNSEKIL